MRRLREKTNARSGNHGLRRCQVEGQHIGHLHGFHFVPDPQADTAKAKACGMRPARRWRARSRPSARRGSPRRPTPRSCCPTTAAIRWMGDPVAHGWSRASKLFDPRVRILSPMSISTARRERRSRRGCKAWLRANIVRLLGPLLELETIAGIDGHCPWHRLPDRRGAGRPGALQGAQRRPRPRSGRARRAAQARHSLRRLSSLPAGSVEARAPHPGGAALGPAKTAGLDQKGIDEIAHLAQSGRTSIPVDTEIAARPLSCRRFSRLRRPGRAGRYLSRDCADLIRPAITYRPGVTPGEPPAGTADGDGFVATVAMTSLVGCAGEDFAMILKSLGYAVERRAGPAITVPLVSPPRVVEQPVVPDVAAAEAATDTDVGVVALPETPQEVAAEAPVPEIPEAATSEVEATFSPEVTLEPEAELVEAAAAEATAPESPASDPTEAKSVPSRARRRSSRCSSMSGGSIVVMRAAMPARAAVAPNATDARGRAKHKAQGRRLVPPDRRHTGARPPGDRPARQDRRPDRRPERREEQGDASRPQNRPPRSGPGRPDDRRGPRPEKRFEGRRDNPPERREKQPDPDSPFAKLLALKAQLEDQKK